MVKTVECSDVGFRYGRRVGVAGLSFTLGTGVTGSLGVNGAGKTTLMRILSALRRPSSGEAFVLGDDISRRKGRSNAMGESEVSAAVVRGDGDSRVSCRMWNMRRGLMEWTRGRCVPSASPHCMRLICWICPRGWRARCPVGSVSVWALPAPALPSVFTFSD